MNRSALCIQMLMMLKVRGKMTTNELAQALETNPRNIREFKKELITAGYNILETRGRTGGYSLEENCLLPSLNFTNQEIQALQESKAFIESHPDFENMKDFMSAYDKILSQSKDIESSSKFYLNETTLTLSLEEKDMLKICQQGIQLSMCVSMVYQSLKQERPEEILVDPYEILHYRNAYYLMAFSHKRNDYRLYRFSKQRMKRCRLTDKKFLRDSSFEIASFVGKHSLIKGKWQKVEIFVAYDVIRIFNEEYWGIDYHQKEVKNGYICSFFCEDLELLYRHLFAFKNKVKIVSPTSCIDSYHKMIKDLLHLYEN